MYKISWPNRITLARILLVAPFVIALLHLQDLRWGEHARWAALGVFALMAISDGLDGYLARRLHAESVIGRFLDPLADKLLILCSFLLLSREATHVAGARLPDEVAVIAVGKDIIVVAGFCIVYFATAKAYIDPKPVGKWCTTVQLAAVIAILLSPSLPGGFRIVPRVLWWSATVLAFATIVRYFQLGMRFVARHEKTAA